MSRRVLNEIELGVLIDQEERDIIRSSEKLGRLRNALLALERKKQNAPDVLSKELLDEVLNVLGHAQYYLARDQVPVIKARHIEALTLAYNAYMESIGKEGL